MRYLMHIGGLTVAAILTAGCSSTPETIQAVEDAREAVRQVEQNPHTDEYARAELQKAENALHMAEKAAEQNEDMSVITHHAYIAERHAEIALARIGEKTARDEISNAEIERSEVLRRARAREADRAKMLAEQRSREAAEARLQADVAMAAAEEMQRELSNLKAEQTDRGIVLTLGDVLFDTDSANLKAGASQTVDRLAGFLKKHPDRELLVEGHTDSRGPEEYNQQLSQRRAEALRIALIDAGVEASRIEARGLGEKYPVASNDTAAGRQENRRVDIVVQSPAESQSARR